MNEKMKETLDQREKTHGLYINVSYVSQSLKIAMQLGKTWDLMMPEQRESLEMIANKIGRILSGNHNFIDHWHDIAGYAMLIAKELEQNNDGEDFGSSVSHDSGQR